MSPYETETFKQVRSSLLSVGPALAQEDKEVKEAVAGYLVGYAAQALELADLKPNRVAKFLREAVKEYLDITKTQ